ncbi:unnamed protein product, partial [Phaeothamnion confervicola]
MDYYSPGQTVVGIDPAVVPESAALREAQRRAAARGVALSAVTGTAEALPFADGSFDAAVATLVLCSVDDPRQALAEIARVLRPDG